MNSEDKVLREQLLALLRGKNAHLSFDDAIANFPPEHINTKPPNVSYTPWHLLEHLRIAQWDILEFMRNPDHVSPEWPKGYWPDPAAQTDEAGWQQTIAEFKADMQAIEELVENPATDFFGPIPHAPDYTVFREVLLVADHNAYHIGEFAILRQVMETW
jgi:hypothetical protein